MSKKPFFFLFETLLLLCLPFSSLVGCQRWSADSVGIPQVGRSSVGGAWFEESAENLGVSFTHHTGHDGERFLMPESVAGGVALLDFDGDGWLDVYLVQSAGPVAGEESEGNRLYRNRGDGTFEDVTAASRAGHRGYGMGASTGDFDGDGDVDLYVTNVGPNVLLRNEGNGTFTDVTVEAGVGDPGFGAGSAFFDFDGDGDLDLFVVSYIHWSEEEEIVCENRRGEPDYCDPLRYEAPAADRLYRNQGDGTFVDVSQQAGFHAAPANGLGILVDDFDGDGRSDLFVTNDRNPNQLWIQQDSGRFEDRAAMFGCAIDSTGRVKAGMGVSSADLDNDGDEEILVVNFGVESDSLFRNDGTHCTDITMLAKLHELSRTRTRFGVGFADFDNDGRLDLYEAAGRVVRFPMALPGNLRLPQYGDDPYAEPNVLVRGVSDPEGGLFFEPVEPRGGTAESLAATSRAAAFGDLDNDGGMDLVVVNRDAPVHLLRNVVADRGGWILFQVSERSGGTALGARLRLRLGERTLTRVVRTSYSYLAASDPRVHLGIGDASEVEAVTVTWIDGSSEAFGDFAAGQIVELRRGAGLGS